MSSAIKRIPPRRGAWLGAALATALFLGPALGDSYELGTGDKLRIAVFDRPDLSGEFTVDGSGKIAIPRLGRISAEGRTPEAVETEIAQELNRRLAGTNVSVIVEVAAFRPFYVLGDVNRPGSYPFAPGITVAQAIAVAGGHRSGDPSSSMLRLEAQRAAEKLLTTRRSLSEALSRRARLEAERDGRSEIQFSESLQGDEEALQVLRQQEKDLFDKRRQGFETELRNLEMQRKLLHSEIAAMEAQLNAKQRQEQLLRAETKEFEDLLKRQLIPVSRFFELQRLLSEVEAASRELQASIFRSRRELAIVEGKETATRQERASEISSALKEVEQQIETLSIGARASREQYETADRGTRRFEGAIGTEPDALTITRRTKDEWISIPATELTPMKPDDVLRVPRPPLSIEKFVVERRSDASP